MAERCALFVIIALGESVVVTGATFAELSWSTETVSAFVSVLAGSIAMWWIYFHKGAEAGSEEISRSSEPGRLARLAYTYLHMPIVAGIIVSAVADELVLKHPSGHSDLKTVISAIGGPLLFLFGTILFKYSFRGFLQLSHGFGIIALVRARLVRGRAVTADAVDPHHRDHDRGRGVGIDLAPIPGESVAASCAGLPRTRRASRTRLCGSRKCRWLHEMARLFPFDDISQDDVGQLDDERPKPRIFLDERHPLGVLNLIPSRVLANRRRAGTMLPIGRWIRVPHD